MSTILGQGCFPSDCEEGERGKRGKRGERGHRGHDGHDGRDGETGPTGPTGATGTAEILHVEVRQENVAVPLPPNMLTPVLITPPLVAPPGSIVQFTGIVQYVNSENSNNFAQPNVVLLVDGLTVISYAETPGAFPQAGGTFLFTTILNLTSFLSGDGLPHTYGLAIQTDSVSDGNQRAVKAVIFVNAVE